MPNHMSIEASRIGRLQEELQRRLAPYRMCCNFENCDEGRPASNLDCRVSGRQLEELVDK